MSDKFWHRGGMKIVGNGQLEFPKPKINDRIVIQSCTPMTKSGLNLNPISMSVSRADIHETPDKKYFATGYLYVHRGHIGNSTKICGQFSIKIKEDAQKEGNLVYNFLGIEDNRFLGLSIVENEIICLKSMMVEKPANPDFEKLLGLKSVNNSMLALEDIPIFRLRQTNNFITFSWALIEDKSSNINLNLFINDTRVPPIPLDCGREAICKGDIVIGSPLMITKGVMACEYDETPTNKDLKTFYANRKNFSRYFRGEPGVFLM